MWVGGVHYELDCLIFASGFEVGTELRPPLRLRDRSGATASRSREHWADGMQTLHGIHVHGFPNLFIVGLAPGRQPDLEHHAQPRRGRHDDRRRSSRHALEVGADEVEVTAEAEQAWVELLESSAAAFLGNPDCTPGYYNNEGQADRPPRALERAAATREGPVAYFDYIDALAQLRRLRGPRVPPLTIALGFERATPKCALDCAPGAQSGAFFG